MNNQILELAKDHLRHEMYAAYGEIVEGDYYEFDQQELIKFAEMIIKETIRVVEKNIAWNGYLNSVEAIKKVLELKNERTN